jgi:hypothetical protein
VKHKHKSLSIEQKVDLLRKLDNGASVRDFVKNIT